MRLLHKISPKYTLIVLSLFILHKSNAQQVSGLLKYSQITAFEDTTRRNLIPVDMQFNNNESMTIQGIIRKMDSQDPSKVYTTVTDQNRRFSVYKNFMTKQMYSRERADTELVIVKDSLEKIDWKIKNEFKKLGTIRCQKAEAMVRGRFYTAWFAPDIPLNFGPWKLQGLPGLILAAKSADNQVEFRFESLQMPAPVNNNLPSIKPFDNVKIVTQQEFYKLAKSNEIKFTKMVESQPGNEHGPVVFTTKWIEIYPKN